MGRGVDQMLKRSVIVREIRLDTLPRFQIRLGPVERGQDRDIAQQRLGHFLAIVFVKAPLPALGIMAIHHDIQPLALILVVFCHEPPLAPLGPSRIVAL